MWPDGDFPDLNYMSKDAGESVTTMGCRQQPTMMERLKVRGQASYLVRIDGGNVLVGRRTRMNEEELSAHVRIDTSASDSSASAKDTVLSGVLAAFPDANLVKLRSVTAHYLNAQVANPFDRIALHLDLLGGRHCGSG